MSSYEPQQQESAVWSSSRANVWPVPPGCPPAAPFADRGKQVTDANMSVSSSRLQGRGGRPGSGVGSSLQLRLPVCSQPCYTELQRNRRYILVSSMQFLGYIYF